MIDWERTLFAVLLALLIYPRDNLGGAFQPEFTKPLANLTVPLGRDAVFTCHVEHLGGYKVGWVKVDTKAIQAIHERVITHNPRVSVFHGDHTAWNLRIKGIQKEDEGVYMCQINTDPMNSQIGTLTVEVPPDFIPGETSGDMVVTEGRHAHLRCRATGIPPPRVSWRREDQKEIIIREPSHEKSSSSNEKFRVSRVFEYSGEDLNLTKIKREEMGVYNCIASNGVPPSISKRITVDVHFQPEIQVPNQLVGAPLGTDVVLECIVQAFPQSINFWRNNNNTMIISSGRHEVQVVTKTPTKTHGTSHPSFKLKMLLTIHNFTKQDVGNYKCAAKNSNGENEGSIRLYDITSVVKQKSSGDPYDHHHYHQSGYFNNNNNNNNGEHNYHGNSSMKIERWDTSAENSNNNNAIMVSGHDSNSKLSSGDGTKRPRGVRRHQNHQHSIASGSCCKALLASMLPLLLYCR